MMMLDAWSLATLADVKRGGCCGMGICSMISSGIQVGKGRPLYCRRSWELDHTL